MPKWPNFAKSGHTELRESSKRFRSYRGSSAKRFLNRSRTQKLVSRKKTKTILSKWPQP